MFDMSGAGLRFTDSPVDCGLAEALQVWWWRERPGWVHEGWYGADVDAEVRALMLLPPGADLAAALQRLSVRRGRPCSLPHTGQSAPGQPAPGRTPGDPCQCQIVVCAAWAAVAEWAANQAVRGLPPPPATLRRCAPPATPPPR